MTHYYYYASGKLLRETYNNVVLDFFYDQNGYPFAFKYNGALYYYITNLQGDVEYILNSTKAIVDGYKYDPYGNIIAGGTTTIGTINPLRYRGYYYDTDTEFYYLESRYYDPKICRFINADALVSTGQGIIGNNMFAYCLNNPIVLSDDCGTISRVCISDEFNPLIMPWETGKGGVGGGNTTEYHYPSPYDKKTGLINGQGVFDYADYLCGVGNYADNGCEIIAIYNSMQLLGCPQSLGAIEHEFSWDHGMLLMGLWGVGPWVFDDYFDAHGVSNVGYGNYDTMMQNISEGDVVVFTVMNNSCNLFEGFHTMAAQYVGGQFVVYNAYSNSTRAWTFSSLCAIYDNSKWIYGYIVGG